MKDAASRHGRVPVIALAALVISVMGPADQALRADTVRLLPGNVEALEARIDVVCSAREQLDVAYFWLDRDAVSLLFLDLLGDAARRGVRVRLLVDAINNHMPANVQERLLRAGVEIREFHRPDLRSIHSFTRRLHEKYLAADGKRMVLGSRNLKNGYFGTAHPTKSFVDLDVLVEGRTVLNTCRYFESLWSSCEVARVDLRTGRKKKHNIHCLPREPLMGCSATGGWPGRLPAREYTGLRECFACVNNLTFEVEAHAMEFLYDPAGRKVRGCGVAEQLYRVLASARHSVTIVTPYFLPAEELGAVLRTLLARGVHVRVLTNSFESTNQPIQYAALLNVVRRYKHQNLEIWEFDGPETLHVKAFVLDGWLTGITSFNFNQRSARIDTEVALVISDYNVAQHMLRTFGCYFHRARPKVHIAAWTPRLNKGERVDPLHVRLMQLAALVIRDQL
jgi:putative cardiolipin synthase